ncbi:MAG: response regulator [Chitinivibrionia bacterium]|nr:response regulator [Chitinivibrionia bacterium]
MRTIYILEDDGSMREMLTRYIRKQGYQTGSFATPFEALPELLSGSGDLVISDIRMPGMSGIEMARTIRAEGVGMPIIFISGECSDEIREQAAALSVRYLLKKPLKDLSLLRSAVEDELFRYDSASAAEGYDDLRTRFLTKLSHEIRTPLTALSLAIDGLSNKTNRAGASEDKLLTISRRNVDRLISLVEDELGTLRKQLFD